MKEGEIEVLLELGQSYLLNKKYKEAISKFKVVMNLNPCDPEIYYYLGMAYEGDGQLDEAKKMYTKAIERNPNFNEAKTGLERLTEKSQGNC